MTSSVIYSFTIHHPALMTHKVVCKKIKKGTGLKRPVPRFYESTEQKKSDGTLC